MKFNYVNSISPDGKAEAYIYFLYRDEKRISEELKYIEKDLKIKFDSQTLKDFKGKDSQTYLVYQNGKRVFLSGVGKKEKFTLEKLRNSCARAVKYAESLKLKKIAIEIFNTDGKGFSYGDIVNAEVESAILGTYSFKKYKKTKSKDEEDDSRINEVVLFGKAGNEKDIKKVINDSVIIANGTITARDIGNEPGNYMYPDSLAKLVVSEGKKHKYDVKVLNEKEIAKLGMGGVIGVGKGSENPPRFIIMKYNGGGNKNPIVFVGKGVTFDTGGISLKPGAGMENMKMDMCGAAAVVGIFNAVASMKLKVNIIGIIPSVENMPSHNAFKPGDILTAYNGMTIEVQNTDAEGRLILADGVAYADNFKPKYIIDMATLTGAALIALGHTASIAITNDNELYNKVRKAGDEVFERVWELPSWDEYDKLIDSDVADVCNIGKGRAAGSITAGMFIKRFVADNKWLHLDIAGTAMLPAAASEYVPKYSSGVGVRLFTKFLINEANNN